MQGGPVNLTLQLQGTQGLNSSGVAALQMVLANLTGQSGFHHFLDQGHSWN